MMHSFIGKSIGIMILTLFIVSMTITGRTPIQVYNFTMDQDQIIFQRLPNKLTNIENSFESKLRYAPTTLIEGPTGIHGKVVKHNDGHLYFEDSTRARFWGVNLVANGINLYHDTIERLTDELAQNGINMIRLHLIDSKNYQSLIDYNSGNSSNLNPEVLDKVDYLISECGKKGIYIYMDLLDGRSFLESEHIINGTLLGPKAPIVSIFNETLIDLQKQFATNLFTHMNPYTNKTYADDPTIALVEITNENGMIWNPYGANTGWLDLPEPYRSELRAKWNSWLLAKYGSRTELDNAWTSKSGEHALRSYEDPASGTVELPDVVNAWAKSVDARNYTDKFLGYPRVNDGSIFAYELLKHYFSTMKQHLRDLGVSVPIGASDDQWEIIPPTQKAISEVLDFSAAGYYYDHPFGTTDKLAQFSNTPELYTDSNAIAPVVSSQRIAGIPIVVREWNFPYPNDYRAEGAIQMAVFACLQDWDAVILHDLGESYWDLQPNKQLVWWPSHNDPARWPQIRAGAIIFLNQLVEPLPLKIDIGYSLTDIFFAQYGYQPWQYNVAPYLGQTRNYFFNDSYDGTADIAIASGRTANATYTHATRSITISPFLKYMDLYCKSENITYMAKEIFPNIEVDMTGNSGTGDFLNFAYDSKTVSWNADRYYPINITTIPAGATVFGNSSDDLWAVGFLTNNRAIMISSEVSETTKTLVSDYGYKPSNGDHNVFEVNRKDSLSARIVIDAFKSWGLTTLSHTDITNKIWRGSSNEWIRDYKNGIFMLNVSKAMAIVGFCDGNRTIGNRAINLEGHHAAISVVAMDGNPLDESKHMLYTSVANAWNTNQNITLTYSTSGNYAYSWVGKWSDLGTAPVIYEKFKSTIYLNRQITGAIVLEDIFGNITRIIHVSNSNKFYIDTNTGNITSMEIFEDTQAPVIREVSIDKTSPQYNESATVRVNISEFSGLANVSIVYRIDGDVPHILPMTYTEHDEWYAEFQPQGYGTVINFYIYAEDYAGNFVIDNNTQQYYTIQWVDTIPPELSEVSWDPQTPNNNENITVSCHIIDEGSGIKTVSLFYKNNGESTYKEIKMTHTNSVYMAVIPAPHNGESIAFYIVAEDNAQNTITFKNGANDWQISVSTTNSALNMIQDNLLIIVSIIGVVIVISVGIHFRRRTT